MAGPISGQLSKKELRDLRRMRLVREALDKFKEEGRDVDIPICPSCKSHRLVQLTGYHDLGYIGSFQPTWYCTECGWWGRTLVVMSNKESNEAAVLDDMKGAFAPLMDPSEPPMDEVPYDE
ncbi:MAG: hypothetical protein ACTSUO_03210 [Candidatus Thorarchaeota archaeon]